MKVAVGDAQIVGVVWDVGDRDELWLCGGVVLELDFDAEWRFACQLDRNGFGDVCGILVICSTVAVRLARTGEARRRPRVDLLRNSDGAVVARVVVVVVVRELCELVVVGSSLRGIHLNGGKP